MNGQLEKQEIQRSELEKQTKESLFGSLFETMREAGWRHGRAGNKTWETPPFSSRGKEGRQRELSEK